MSKINTPNFVSKSFVSNSEIEKSRFRAKKSDKYFKFVWNFYSSRIKLYFYFRVVQNEFVIFESKFLGTNPFLGGLLVVLLFSPYIFLCIEIGFGRLSLSKNRQNCYSKHLSMALCPGISIQFLNLSKSRHATRQIEISSGTLSKKSTEKFLVKNNF